MILLFPHPFHSTGHAEDNPEESLIINKTLYGDSTNFGRIYNYSTALHGMWGSTSTMVNAPDGEIKTFGSSAYGIYGTESSNIFNYGSIITMGSGAYGLYVTKTSSGENSGLIHTYGIGAYGTNVRENSTFRNTSSGTIVTENESASGILAFYATAINSGIIRTYGKMSRGMAGTWFAEVQNEGLIEIGQNTNGYGLWALQNSSLTNSGTINVLGDESFGIYISQSSSASNTGAVTTRGINSPGIYANDYSTAGNYGTVTTYGHEAFGFVANNGSTARNYKDIVTYGPNAIGMLGTNSSQLFNLSSETIETWSDGASGMVVSHNSYGENTGTIITHGNEAHGSVVYDSSSITNKESGRIITYGERSYGMYIYGNSTGSNSGKIAVYGKDSYAVFVEKSSFYNSGELYSKESAALVATEGSNITLYDGTTLSGSNLLLGDESSSINVNIKNNISASIFGFGSLIKDGKGSLMLEGNSFANNSYNREGTLIITEGSQLATNSYTQGSDATLQIIADNHAPAAIIKEAYLDGKINIDISNLQAPGEYSFLTVDSLDGNFDYVAFEDKTGSLCLLAPKWDYENGKWHYRSMVTYSFSEQALGLVAAVEGRDVPKNMLLYKIGNQLENPRKEPVFYGKLLKSQSTRKPSETSPAGFNTETIGITLGYDHGRNNSLIEGICAGYTERNIWFTNVPMAKYDWEKQKEWHINKYIAKKFNRWALVDIIGYRHIDHYSFRKQVVNNATARFQSWSISNDISFIYTSIDKLQSWSITPYIGLSWELFKRESYNEVGGMGYDDFDTNIIQGVIGFSAKTARKLHNTSFNSHLDFAWLHLLKGKDIDIKAFYGENSILYKETMDKDLFFINLSLSLANRNGITFHMNGWGRFGKSCKNHGISAQIEWSLQ